MSLIKTIDSTRYIPKDTFLICEIDKANSEEITKQYKTRAGGAYYLDKFENYINDKHNTSIIDYVEKYLKTNWPRCPISKEKVGYKLSGKGLIFSTFKRGRISKETCENFKKGCEKLSKSRKGEKNPMFGKKPWNKGKTKHTDDRVASISNQRMGIKFSKEHKDKLKKRRAESQLKARHIQKHTKESKEKMRQATVKRWENGDFSFKKTSIESKVEIWLKKNGFNFEFQKQIGGFVADFACKKSKTIIECNGDFFHCNPSIPKYSSAKYPVQKRNTYRDKLKRMKYKSLGWSLIELWETDIHSGEFKEILLCALKK